MDISGILRLLLVMITMAIYCSTSNTVGGSFRQDMYHKNFGCPPGDSVIHLPNGPNCRCGYYAVNRHKKHIAKLPPEERMAPYWTSDGKLQFYLCIPCVMCDSHKPVLAKCSSTSDTVCGSSCVEPYTDTNAGCFLIPDKNTSLYTVPATTSIPFTSQSFEAVTTTERPSLDKLIYGFGNTHTCIKHEIFIGAAVCVICMVLFLPVCMWCFRQRSARPFNNKWSTICNRFKQQGKSNIQASTNNISIDESPNEEEQLAGRSDL